MTSPLLPVTQMPAAPWVWPAWPVPTDLGKERSRKALPTWQHWEAGEDGSLVVRRDEAQGQTSF